MTIKKIFVAAVALANQLFFVLSLFFLGLTANTGIMMAQYLGKKDWDKVNQIFMLSCRISIAVCFCFSIIAIFFPETLVKSKRPKITIVKNSGAPKVTASRAS